MLSRPVAGHRGYLILVGSKMGPDLIQGDVRIPVMRKPLSSLIACVITLWTLGFSAAALFISHASAQSAVEYSVEIEGVEDGLEDLIRSTSRLLSGLDTPPFGLAGLRQRAETDVESFRSALRSQGYYGGLVTFDIDAEETPIVVTVTVDPGPLFHISQCVIMVPDPSMDFIPANCNSLGLGTGTPARSDAVLAGQTQLRRLFLENGYPFAVIDRRAVVNHDGSIMNLTFTPMPGEKIFLGSVLVEGQDRTDGSFLEELRTWELGDTYDVRKIDSYRERLNGLALFDSTQIAPVDSDDEPRPIRVTVHEAPPRTVGGGVRYATTEGVGLSGFWVHRNLFGGAETLRVELGLAELAQSLTATYSLPHRPNPEQRLDFTASATHEETDAYSKLGGDLIAAFTTPLAEKLRGRIGVGLHLAEINDGTGPVTSATVSLPADVFYDNSDSLLNPTTGERFSFRATPVVGESNGFLAFLRLESEATAYRRLTDDGGTVIAGRIKIGTIFGEALNRIPADRRFYSGGGGSVRGYGYQAIGPQDADGNPAGGRSVAEAGLELRQRVTDTWGGVAFVEAGTMGRGLTNLETPQVGAGVGIRYFTAFGPIRADVATPLNPRPGDASFQIYISIGQAF
jgi:translocation and assembly module TamA